jgi:isoquinoline 1-oxidoreductase subunit beta
VGGKPAESRAGTDWENRQQNAEAHRLRRLADAHAKLPGMKYAVIARPPVMGGKLASYDGSAAMKVPGVEKIVVIDGTPPPSKFQPIGGVALIARNTWAAIKGREALLIRGDDGPHASYDSAAYKAQLEETARKPGKVVRDEGGADKAFADAAKTVTVEY